MNIKALIPTHNRLRNPEKIRFFDNYYTKPIELSNVDGRLYVHDGHHRLVYECSKGKHIINDDCFRIKNFTLEEYNTINLKAGYYTPFDLENECRKPNFFEYKNLIKQMILISNNDNYIFIANFIRETKYMYIEKRVVSTIEELTDNYLRGV